MIDFRELINRYKDGDTKILRYVVMASVILGSVTIAVVIFYTLPGSTSSTPTEVTASTEFQIRSIAFNDGKPMSAIYTGDSEDRSPPLDFVNVPAGAVELALICDDPDAGEGGGKTPWTHWVIYKIPVDAGGLAEGVVPGARPRYPVGAMQGRHSWGELATQDDEEDDKPQPAGQKEPPRWQSWDASTMGYRGPMPPDSSKHHYVFTLYVLNAPLEDAEPGFTKAELLAAMQGKIITQTNFTGTYKH